LISSTVKKQLETSYIYVASASLQYPTATLHFLPSKE